MERWRGTFEMFAARTREYLRRNWRKALPIREKLSLSEEATHLLIAGVVGLMGGAINVLFYLVVDKVQVLAVGHPGQNIVQAASELSPIWRVITPTLGGMAAGAILA